MKFESCPPRLPDIKSLRQRANQYLVLDKPAIPKMLESSSEEEVELHSSSEDEKFLHQLRMENKRFESLLYNNNDPSERLKEKFKGLHHKV